MANLSFEMNLKRMIIERNINDTIIDLFKVHKVYSKELYFSLASLIVILVESPVVDTNLVNSDILKLLL